MLKQTGRTAMAIVLLALFIASPAVHAGIIVHNTRVVFPAAEGEATVRLTNTGKRPSLVEAWIDKGNSQATPDTVHTPFLITPPVFRMNAGKDQSLRIIFTQSPQPLPTDRESLFWLNVLAIPPKPTGEAAHKNTLQFSIRSRLKLFYRPPGLKSSVGQAPDRLSFTLDKNQSGFSLIVHNPTPYYVTLSKAVLQWQGGSAAAKTGMVAPFGQLPLALKGLAQRPPAASTVSYSTINDYGGASRHKGQLGKAH